MARDLYITGRNNRAPRIFLEDKEFDDSLKAKAYLMELGFTNDEAADYLNELSRTYEDSIRYGYFA